MGAISDPSSVPILKEFLTDPERSVRETCEIAMAKIEWDNSEEGKKHHASLDESSVQYVASHSYFPAFDKSLVQALHIRRSRTSLLRAPARHSKSRGCF